tara:strand:- start:298 stop:462 length:165 start_codon:yes stop_codon:yes gene_type:complete
MLLFSSTARVKLFFDIEYINLTLSLENFSLSLIDFISTLSIFDEFISDSLSKLV